MERRSICTRHEGCYALILRDQSILLIRKQRGPYTRLLDLPGGKIEEGESPIEGLKREILEETGLELTEATWLMQLEHHVEYVNQEGEEELLHHLGQIYRVEVAPGEAIGRMDVEDSAGAVWVEIGEIRREEVAPFVWGGVERVSGRG